jgi:hypothetical protein
MLWSALAAAEAVAASRPLFLCLFVAAAGFAAHEWYNSRLASAISQGVAAAGIFCLWELPQMPSAEMSAAMFLFGVGLWPRARKMAAALAVTALSIAATPTAIAWFAFGIASMLIGFAGSRFSLALPFQVRRRAILLTAVAAALPAALPRSSAGDGPYQYEAAARACHAVAANYPRNSWLIVSPPQELSCAYGRGWHLELREFVARTSREQLSRPDFRFAYPVEHVLFFLEKRPLWTSESDNRLASARMDGAVDSFSRAYLLPLGRAALEFETAELLAAYAASHSDLETLYEDENVAVYRAPGALRR